jgi:hypothetical protein
LMTPVGIMGEASEVFGALDTLDAAVGVEV